MKGYTLLMAMVLTFSSVAHGESSISLLWHPQANSYNEHSVFHTPEAYIEQPDYSNQLVTEFTHSSSIQQLEINLLASASHQNPSGGKSQSDIYINEFIADYSRGNWDFNIGRKIESWGVGYSFRPLDIIQQVDQQRLSRQSLVGKDGLFAEYYSHNSATSLLLLAPTRHNQNIDNRTIAGRYFTTYGDHDLQLVGQYNRDSKAQLGAGGVTIINDQLALHGSINYQQQYTQMFNTLTQANGRPLSTQNPYQAQQQKDALQAVMGFSYTSENRHSFIAEYGYDDTSYSRKQWKAIYQLANQQHALLNDPLIPEQAIWRNIAWSALASQYATRPRHSLMLQWQYEGDHWQPSVTTLFAIEDSSHMSTLALQRQFDSLYLDIGVRHFSRKTDAFYGESILSNTIYATFSSEF